MTSLLLRKVSIKRFKQFKDVVFDLSNPREYEFNKDVLTGDGKLVKTALVYGRNGAGKSNLGLALMDISLHLTENQKRLDLYDYYINADSDVRSVEFSYEFLNGEDVYRYRYVKTDPQACVFESFSVNDELVFSIDNEKREIATPGARKYGFETLRIEEGINISLLRFIATNSSLSENNPISLVMNFVRGMLYFKRVDMGNWFIGLTPKTDANIFGYIVQSGALKDFEGFLNKAGVDETLAADENEANYNNIKIYFKHRHQNLPINAVGSSGILSMALQFYWMIRLEEASFVFIDEFDAFYHSELSEYVYEFFKSINFPQFVLTTHNTNLLSNRIGRPDSFYIVTPNKIATMSSLTKREIREGNNIENLYLGGAFGGL